MTIHYDAKGKFFTEVISKERIPTIIQTNLHLIHGDIHARSDERIKDELNREERFIAITDAIIYDLHGTALYKTDFMTLHRDAIIWLIPRETDVETHDMVVEDEAGASE